MAASSSSSDSTTFIPIPPPPPDGFTSSGSPISLAAAIAVAESVMAPLAGVTGTPVAIRSSRHARITRIAISPRLAIRTFLKSLLFIPSNVRACASSHREQWLGRTDDLTLSYVHLTHRTGDRGDDVVLHLHRLEHR